jgi:putative FmdB family regulatory protein
MPIYEFKCNKCGRQFEQLCRLSWQGTVSCPGCSSDDLSKVVSAFASPGSGSASGGCGGCSGKNCSTCK